MSVSSVRVPRVLFLVNTLSTGGAERHLVELVRRGALHNKFKAYVVCLKQPGELTHELQSAGVPIQWGWLAHKYNPAAIQRVVEFAATTQSNLVYSHTGRNELFLAQIARTFLGIPSVCVVHTTTNAAAGEHFDRFQRILMRRASAVVALANKHHKYLIDSERLDPRRTVRIYHGIDHVRFCPRAGPPMPILPSLTDRRVIGVVGSLTREKGHRVLLEAIPRVIARCPDATFVFAGAGPEEHILRHTVATLGLGDRVIFLGVRQDVHRVLLGLDVFVLPSLPFRETFSVATLEAMASAVPVVVTRVGSMDELVNDGREGFVVAPGDSAALADRVVTILHDRGLARQMGLAGRDRVERNFTVDTMVEAYTSLFRRLSG